MAFVENWMPPTKENYDFIVFIFQFFPLVTIFQWIQPWYGAGKTSTPSRLNLPGKPAWIIMEMPSILIMTYIMYALPKQLGGSFSDLPWENKTLAGLYILHYINRAIIGPLIAPSLSPIHLLVFLMATTFQILNATSLACYFAGYGPLTRAAWQVHGLGNYITGGRMELGLMIFFLGLILNIFHDDELREIRRAAARNEARRAQEADSSRGLNKGAGAHKAAEKVYMIPQNFLFNYVLYPHYFCEWIEWAGYWLIAGGDCVPARTFLVNEIAAMLPRALQGKRWYIEKFGAEKIGSRKAVIPGLL